ncbi:MAG: DUF2202 domain-containing protein [Spirochaetales bacterium]|nr:DUF2202 domain-containing protein [Spirochaetales bacterium]
MKKIIILTLSLFSFMLFSQDFGSKGALESKDFTVEEMLSYAIQDEYLALNEYQAIIKKFGNVKPFINIISSEKTHIEYLENIYKTYNYKIPSVDTTKFIHLPDSLDEAAKIGVDAEIANIAMYDKFLKQKLPNDIREVFEFLKKGSENHLQAFKKQL